LCEAEELKLISQTEPHHDQMPREGGGQMEILLNGENTFVSVCRRIEASMVTLLSVTVEGDFNLHPCPV